MKLDDTDSRDELVKIAVQYIRAHNFKAAARIEDELCEGWMLDLLLSDKSMIRSELVDDVLYAQYQELVDENFDPLNPGFI